MQAEDVAWQTDTILRPSAEAAAAGVSTASFAEGSFVPRDPSSASGSAASWRRLSAPDTHVLASAMVFEAAVGMLAQ